MEEAFFDVPWYREFAQLNTQLPDESTTLRFRHRLEKHKLVEQILASVDELLTSKGLLLKVDAAVDSTLIAAPTSTKNPANARDPKRHWSKKGNQCGVDARSELVHIVNGTAGNVHNIA